MKKLLSHAATLLLMLVLAAVAQAEPSKGWNPTDKDQIFFTVQSRIMAIDHARKTLVVAEQEIELFSEQDNGRELTTLLRNASGQAIEWTSLQRGNLVFVRGFEQSEAPVLAREIYLLPAENGLRTFPFQKNIPDWAWSPVRAKAEP